MNQKTLEILTIGMVILWLLSTGIAPVTAQEGDAEIQPSEEEGTQYNLTVDVVDGIGDPIQGANVTIDETTKKTDGDGVVVFELEDGSYDIEVTSNGYQNDTSSVVVDGEDESLTVELISPSMTQEDEINILILAAVGIVGFGGYMYYQRRDDPEEMYIE